MVVLHNQPKNQSTPLLFFFVFRRHRSSKFVGKAMNKGDALRHLPSVCTTAVTIATDFMQVMHVHKWTCIQSTPLLKPPPKHTKATRTHKGQSTYCDPKPSANCTKRETYSTYKVSHQHQET